MMWLMFACGDNVKESSDTAEMVQSSFANEDTLSLGEERYVGFYKVELDLMNGLLLPFEAPASTYEIVEIMIDVYTGADDCTGTVNLFALATEDPLAVTALTEFYTYEGLAPYVFPEIPNSRSGVLALTSDSNPTPSDLEDGSSGYEFSLRFDSPLLVEDGTPFWVGIGLYEDERTCLSAVDIGTPVGYVFGEGRAYTTEDLGYDSIVKMRAKVRY